MSTTHPSSRHTTSPDPESPPTSTLPSATPIKLPSRHNVVTAIPLTVTPASAVSANSSNRPSPAFPALNPLAMPPPGSLQATPDMSPLTLGHAGIPPITLPPSLSSPPLPASVSSPPLASPSAMSEAITMSKGSNMIRRMSSRLRRRTSHSQTSRDQSAGPTMMRRRSDSNRHVTDSGVEFDGYEPEMEPSASEDAVDESFEASYFGPGPHGLGISTARASVSSSDPTLGPVRPMALEQGFPLIKVTKKKKKKQMLFRVDYEAAKLCWHPSDASKAIYIDDITELLYGKDACHYHDEYQVPDEERGRFFSITYADPDGTMGRNQKTMHLIAPNAQLYKLWVEQLNIVSRMRIEMVNGFARGGERSLRRLWLGEMHKRPSEAGVAEAEARIEFADLRRLCRKLNINCSEQTLQSRFAKVDTDHTGSLDFSQYMQFMRKLLDRKEVRELFKRIKPAVDADLDYDSFVRFLTEEQKINVAENPTRWQRVFENCVRVSRKEAGLPPVSPEPAKAAINGRAFQILIADSEVFPVLAECPPEPRLDRPLNEYFISSSHNTYLPSRQYIAPASVEPYKASLRAGCRCIEIDCWDGASGKPEVRHGPYTSAVAFSDCISVVNQYAFQTCKYPLIISLEVHCGAEQQAVMVSIMKNTFGEKLVTEELFENSDVLPSPEQLKEKILLKVKAADVPEEPEPTSIEPAQQRRGRGLSSPFSRPVAVPENDVSYGVPPSNPSSMSPPQRTGSFSPTPPKGSTSASTPASINSSSEDSDAQSPKNKKHKTSKIVPALGELAVYTQGVSFRKKNFESPELQTYNHVVSLSEGHFKRLTSPTSGSKPNEPRLVDKHNVHHLMRVYPAGKRVNSTNFDPLTTWRHGVQMAALNWQTYDVPLQLNRAMFAGGAGTTGYALKPAGMRPGKESDADEDCEELPRRKGKKLVQFEIEMVSAKQLPRQGGMEKDVPTNPFIELEVHCADEKARGVITGSGGENKSAPDGLTGQGSPLRLRTSVRFDNGHDPFFNQKFAVSVETKFPSLVFVRWMVWNAVATDGRNESTNGKPPIGTYTARLSNLQQGYRFIPLFDSNGEQYLFSSLLCRIKVNDDIQLDEPNSSVQSLSSQPSAFPPSSPPMESSKRSFFGRVLHRSPSGRKRTDARSEPGSVTMSRSTSIEK